MLGTIRAWIERRVVDYRLARQIAREGSYYSIEWDSERLRLKPRLTSSRFKEYEISWGQISKIVAFKRDSFTVDSIRLLVVGPATTFEVSEDDLNWQQLITALPTLLPGCKADLEWWQAVAFPAFETNMTVIYSRSAD